MTPHFAAERNFTVFGIDHCENGRQSNINVHLRRAEDLPTLITCGDH